MKFIIQQQKDIFQELNLLASFQASRILDPQRRQLLNVAMY